METINNNLALICSFAIFFAVILFACLLFSIPFSNSTVTVSELLNVHSLHELNDAVLYVYCLQQELSNFQQLFRKVEREKFSVFSYSFYF